MQLLNKNEIIITHGAERCCCHFPMYGYKLPPKSKYYIIYPVAHEVSFDPEIILSKDQCHKKCCEELKTTSYQYGLDDASNECSPTPPLQKSCCTLI